MKAILLAAGYGTRLRPLTKSVPKCLVEVNGRPLLDIWLQQLSTAGFSQVLINTHYLHEKVEEYLRFSKYRGMVTTSYESELLGSIGTVRQNLGFIAGGECMIAHADNYCLPDWQDFRRRFEMRPENCAATLMLFNTSSYRSCGMVETDKQCILRRYVEKPQLPWQGTLANGAVFWCSYSCIQQMCLLRPNQNDICRDFLPGLVNRANTFINDHIHLDLGTLEALQKANQIARQQRDSAGVV